MPKNPLNVKNVMILNVNILVPIHDSLNPSLHGLTDEQIADRISDHINEAMFKGTTLSSPENSPTKIGEIELDFDWGRSTVSRPQNPNEMGFGEGQIDAWNSEIDKLEADSKLEDDNLSGRD